MNSRQRWAEPVRIGIIMEQWLQEQPIKGQMELPLIIPAEGLRFCDEVNSEFPSDAKPGADWGTWGEKPCTNKDCIRSYSHNGPCHCPLPYTPMEPPC